MSHLPAATDVVIVGAGPTGLTLAASLVAGGVDVVLLDRRPRARTPRAPPLCTPAPWRCWRARRLRRAGRRGA